MNPRFVCLGLALWATTVAAQTPTVPPSPAQRSDEMTLTGCVKSPAADAAAPGAKPVYTLEVAAATPSGAPASDPSSAPAKKVYSLSAEQSVALSKHVGHRVQLKGELLQPPGMRPSPETSPLPAGEEATFRVTSLKMLSATCR